MVDVGIALACTQNRNNLANQSSLLGEQRKELAGPVCLPSNDSMWLPNTDIVVSIFFHIRAHL